MTTQLQIDAKAAADLIRDPAHWTTGTHAKAANGEHRGPRNTDAVCWCVDGAIARVTMGTFAAPEEYGEQRYFALLGALNYRLGAAPFTVNDGPGGHARILAALDAIAEGS